MIGLMCQHETKSCPRCGAAFECKPGTITECQCFGLVIGVELRKLLDQRYGDCLCRACLQHLQQEVNLFREKHFLP